jgi:hypothetical protein
MTRTFAALLMTHLLVTACRPARPSVARWCPPSNDSVAGWWTGSAREYGSPPGIQLRRDSTIVLVHGGGRGGPSRWSYSPTTCELAFSLVRLDSLSVAAFRHEEALRQVARFDSGGERVVLILSRDPPRFFFNGSYFQR